MTLFIFAAVLGGALVLFGLSFLLEKRKLWKDDVLQGITGVKDWRTRLNGLTDRFVVLGAEPLLARAASKSNDPAQSKLTGQTRALYLQLKDYFVALSYAHNCGTRAVQQAENCLKPKGLFKLVNFRRVTKLAEEALTIKEVSPERYTRFVTPERYGHTPPVYRLDYVLSVSEKLASEITAGLAKIAETPGKVSARLTTADKNLALAKAQNTALADADVNYLPYQQRLEAIAAARARVQSTLESDPLGALTLCTDLDRSIQALADELTQAKQQLAAVNTAVAQLAETDKWVAKVRATAVTCPWSDAPGENACWHLSTPDSNPDSQLAQAETLLSQARQSLANGQLPAVSGECKQANVARTQAEKMVKALIDSKAAVDEQVPRVRAELAAIHGELVGITGGETTHEMAQLVARTCTAVEGRVSEVYNLYRQQLFPEALTLLTGTAGNEYGMPVAKLLAQGKELLELLKKAAKVANSLAKQTA
jgi:hypothetical protein